MVEIVCHFRLRGVGVVGGSSCTGGGNCSNVFFSFFFLRRNPRSQRAFCKRVFPHRPSIARPQPSINPPVRLPMIHPSKHQHIVLRQRTNPVPPSPSSPAAPRPSTNSRTLTVLAISSLQPPSHSCCEACRVQCPVGNAPEWTHVVTMTSLARSACLRIFP